MLQPVSSLERATSDGHADDEEQHGHRMVKHPRAEMAGRTVVIAGETARLRLSSMLIHFTSRQPRRSRAIQSLRTRSISSLQC
jgi:hypothetical protein